ncbi:MAG TPA: hypothetical protein PKI15_11280 [Candidatus Cloacimonadota bacterium]|nr:hypothetical protein [Candidatus Cloacimonadota bacterium]
MEMLQVQESVMLPSRQWDRGTGTADFAMARGFVLNVSSRALSVKLKEDAAGVVSYYIQGVQYMGAVINVLTSAGAALTAGDVTILY